MAASLARRKALALLKWLEGEAAHVDCEVVGQCADRVLFFSGGKNSICLLRLAERALCPTRFPLPLQPQLLGGHGFPRPASGGAEGAAHRAVCGGFDTWRTSWPRPVRSPPASVARPASTTTSWRPLLRSTRRRGTSDAPCQAFPGAGGQRALRLTTCGSVDEGKSTLIGRLLIDNKSVPADVLCATETTSRRRGIEVGRSLTPDRWPAGRVRAVITTIDVAHRDFLTEPASTSSSTHRAMRSARATW